MCPFSGWDKECMTQITDPVMALCSVASKVIVRSSILDPRPSPCRRSFKFSTIQSILLDLKSSGEVTRAVFLVSALTLPTVGAWRATLRVGFSWRDRLKLERNIVDRIATTRDGLLMLKIALHGKPARAKCT